MLMLPLSRNQRDRRADFQAFLLYGYKDCESLKAAIIKMNPNLTEVETNEINKSMQVFSDFLKETKFTQEIVSDMVVVDRDQLAYLRIGDFMLKKHLNYQETVMTTNDILTPDENYHIRTVVDTLGESGRSLSFGASRASQVSLQSADSDDFDWASFRQP